MECIFTLIIVVGVTVDVPVYVHQHSLVAVVFRYLN